MVPPVTCVLDRDGFARPEPIRSLGVHSLGRDNGPQLRQSVPACWTTGCGGYLVRIAMHRY